MIVMKFMSFCIAPLALSGSYPIAPSRLLFYSEKRQKSLHYKHAGGTTTLAKRKTKLTSFF